MSRRVLVTGDRRWSDQCRLFDALDSVHAEDPISVLIEGCASGADEMSGDHKLWAYPRDGWARDVGVQGLHFPAQWRTFGRAAGPIRNQQQLDEGRPDLVVAFHDDLSSSRGTRDMVRRALKAGVSVTLVQGRSVIKEYEE